MATLLYKLSSKYYKGQTKESSSPRTARYPWSQKKLRNSQRTLPRFGHATISHPKYGLIIYGGKHKGHAKKELFTINPVTLTTSIIPSIGESPSQRIYSALATFDKFIVLYGGEPLTFNQTWDPSVYILDLDTNRWTRSPSNQRVGERSGHSMLACKNKFYIWGGKRSSHAFLNDLCVFQVRNGKYGDWERTTFLPGTAPLPRSNHCSVLFGENIFIFGGGNKQQLFNDVWVYDLQQKTWECITATGFIPSPRHYCSVSLINGVMYVHGGKDELGQDLHELYGFKIKNRCWYMFQNMGRAPSARFGHTMTPVGSKLYVIGGDHVNSATKADDPLTVHILDNDKVSYPPENAVSPTNTTSTTFSQRRTSSPILPPGDRPASVSSNTTTTDILCQTSESTPVTSSTLGSLAHPISSRSTPMPTLAPGSTPSRSSSFQATPLVSPTCSSPQSQIFSRPISSVKTSPKAPHRTPTDVAKLQLSTQANEKTTPYLHSPVTTTLVPSNDHTPPHTRLSINDLSASSPIPHNQHPHTSMDYVDEKSSLLQEIKSRDRTISEMKNKEHWWRTQVAKARGIGGQPMETTTDLEQQLHLMCFSDDSDDDGHVMNSNGIPDGRIKRLLFEQLVIAKSEARHIKRDIQATSKSVSMKLDHEDRIRKAALDEANHYKALCATLLHRGKSTTINDGEENLLHGMENDDQSDGLELYQAQQERRATHLKTNLDKVLQDNFAMKKELVTIQEESRTNELQRYMVAKQLDEEHARAERTQAAYSAALKRLYMLQKRTHVDEQKHSVNQHHIKLLEDQLESVQHQLNEQQELKHSRPFDHGGGDLSASTEKNKDCIMEWELKNNDQQETITTLKQQLAQATHLMRSLHTDLKKSTSDWSTVITTLKITKSEIESLAI